MEKFYIVNNADLRKHYFDHKENQEQIRLHVVDFKTKMGIESTGYYAREDALYITPTEKDVVNFGRFLGSEVGDRLRPFKKNTKIGKAWSESIKEAGLKFLHKPMLGFYFKGYGKHRTRLFHIDDIVYCSFSYDYDFENPEGFEEIKASEFFKVIEEYNSKFE